MDTGRRAWCALGIALVYSIVLGEVLHGLLQRSERGVEWFLVTGSFLLVAYSLEDLLIATIMGTDGLFVLQLLRALKEKLRHV